MAETISAHPWLLAATDDLRVDPAGLDSTEIFAGLTALLGTLVDCVNLLAAEIDGHEFR